MPPTPPAPRAGARPQGPRSAVAGGKSDAELLEEARRAEAGESGKTAAADQAHEANLRGELEALAGTDLDFDVESLIQDGSISKTEIMLLPARGTKPALYCDMHTLSKEEDLLVERLVAEVCGLRTMGREYTQARGTAILAMAVTRFNNRPYPVPDYFGERDEAWMDKWAGKVELFKHLLKAQSQVSEGLAIIYQNLGAADLLKEDAKKKSSPQPQA